MDSPKKKSLRKFKTAIFAAHINGGIAQVVRALDS